MRTHLSLYQSASHSVSHAVLFFLPLHTPKTSDFIMKELESILPRKMECVCACQGVREIACKTVRSTHEMMLRPKHLVQTPPIQRREHFPVLSDGARSSPTPILHPQLCRLPATQGDNDEHHSWRGSFKMLVSPAGGSGAAVPAGEPGWVPEPFLRPWPPVPLQVDGELALLARRGFPAPDVPPGPADCPPDCPGALRTEQVAQVRWRCSFLA